MFRQARVAALIAAATMVGSFTAVSPAQAATTAVTSDNARHAVIVLLKDQPPAVSLHSSALTSRQARIRAAQASIIKKLRSTSKNVHPFQLINAVSATVSGPELATLKADPSVASVIADEVIKGPAPESTDPASSLSAVGTTIAAKPRTPPPGTCPKAGAKPMLEPQALSVTHTQSDTRTALTARTAGYTGKDVKVAYMAEGININNPDFVRADGSKVFVDYQDFSSDGTAEATDGEEAFLDASAIAAQGLHKYNIRNFSAVPLNRACYIRIEGMAPGASLVGLKVFGARNQSTTSGFLQAIDYAVNMAKVDVLNESFGTNAFPDEVTSDAVAMFDRAAVAAGVTVTVSTGDAGPTNTIGSPATDPSVISVGATTTYRAYAQTGYGGYYPLAKKGWLNDNISPLSSGGFSQAGRTLDLVAPGDIDFALCSTSTRYNCGNFAGYYSSVEESGGTSESAPLTAGAAALVIQAYRTTHGGADPTPALVKQLLVNTADDLGHPAEQQGSGRLNSYKAVRAAASVHDANGSPARIGATMLTSKTQLDTVAAAATTATGTLRLTNNGSTSQKVALTKRTLGPAKTVVTSSVKLSNSTSKHFTDVGGVKTNYVTVKFKVPTGRNRLDLDYVYPAQAEVADLVSADARVRVALIDPKGRFAAHSLPQGVGDAGHLDVRNPYHGTWTAMIWSRTNSKPKGLDGFLGTVKYTVTTHNFTTAGTVTPTSVTIAPGVSKLITVSEKTPAAAGDRADSLVIRPKTGQAISVPIALRSLINLSTGGHYAGVLTGGNGRDGGAGQNGYFQFDVPSGLKDLTTNFKLSGGALDPSFGYLIDPDGNIQANATNYTFTSDGDGRYTENSASAMSIFHRAPIAGRWTLILNFSPFVTGNTLKRPYSGTIMTDTVQVSTDVAVPDDAATKLPAGAPVTIKVTVKNTGVAPESFFVDPRLTTSSEHTLAGQSPATVALPLPADPSLQVEPPQWNVPTETSQVAVGVSATVPVTFDFGSVLGDPDLAATSQGTSASGSYSGNPVPAGGWYAAPSEIGPYGSGGAPAGSATARMTATMLDFDPAVTSSVGDFEQRTVDPAATTTPFPKVVNVLPGGSVTIPVTITPSGDSGTVVNGNLFVDAIKALSASGFETGQELVALPYTYTIS